jgi:hypothetical protein
MKAVGAGKICVLWFMLFALPAHASDSVGSDFLLAAPHARTAALNSAFTAIADDANAVLFNPAGLILSKDIILSMTHFSSFVDTNYEYACFVFPQGKWALGGSVMYDYTSNFNWITGDDVNKGAVNNYDFLAAAALGYSIIPNLSAGVCIKAFRSEILDYSKYGLAFDAGLLMKLGTDPDVYMGIVLQNAGWQTAYETQADAMPVIIKIGAGVKLRTAGFLSLLIDIDVSRLITADETSDIGTGMELGFYDVFYVSAGFGLKHSGDNYSVGAGIRPVRQAKISYAFQPFEGLGLTHRISLDLYL